MKRAKSELNDWGRPEYKRADLGELVRGKYAKRIRESTNVVVLDAQLARVFPNDEAVNDALRTLIRSTRSKINLKPNNKFPPIGNAPRSKHPATFSSPS